LSVLNIYFIIKAYSKILENDDQFLQKKLCGQTAELHVYCTRAKLDATC